MHLLNKKYYNAKIMEIKKKMQSISGFATTAALTSIEYPNRSKLIK